MLEITIYKVAHSTEREAKKLIHYIRSSNVWAPEHPFQTEERAEVSERNWAKMMKLGLSRTEFNKRLAIEVREADGPQRIGYAPPSSVHRLKVHEYMFRNNNMFYSAERWRSDLEAGVARELSDQGYEIEHKARMMILGGKLEEGLGLIMEAYMLMGQSTEKRDQNIAENLESAEDNLRVAYPDIGEVIKLGISLGYAHQPEKFANVPVSVLNLASGSGFYHEIHRMIKERVAVADAVPILKKILEKNPSVIH